MLYVLDLGDSIQGNLSCSNCPIQNSVYRCEIIGITHTPKDDYRPKDCPALIELEVDPEMFKKSLAFGQEFTLLIQPQKE